VTDDDGASSSASQAVTLLITLSTKPYKVKGVQYVQLSWAGATTAVDIYRQGTKVATAVTNSGRYDDRIGTKGGGTYTYRVCETGTTAADACSNTSTVTF
jgi:thermitase